jgi:hypothetical protein
MRRLPDQRTVPTRYKAGEVLYTIAAGPHAPPDRAVPGDGLPAYTTPLPMEQRAAQAGMGYPVGAYVTKAGTHIALHDSQEFLPYDAARYRYAGYQLVELPDGELRVLDRSALVPQPVNERLSAAPPAGGFGKGITASLLKAAEAKLCSNCHMRYTHERGRRCPNCGVKFQKATADGWLDPEEIAFGGRRRQTEAPAFQQPRAPYRPGQRLRHRRFPGYHFTYIGESTQEPESDSDDTPVFGHSIAVREVDPDLPFDSRTRYFHPAELEPDEDEQSGLQTIDTDDQELDPELRARVINARIRHGRAEYEAETGADQRFWQRLKGTPRTLGRRRISDEQWLAAHDNPQDPRLQMLPEEMREQAVNPSTYAQRDAEDRERLEELWRDKLARERAARQAARPRLNFRFGRSFRHDMAKGGLNWQQNLLRHHFRTRHPRAYRQHQNSVFVGDDALAALHAEDHARNGHRLDHEPHTKGVLARKSRAQPDGPRRLWQEQFQREREARLQNEPPSTFGLNRRKSMHGFASAMAKSMKDLNAIFFKGLDEQAERFNRRAERTYGTRARHAYQKPQHFSDAPPEAVRRADRRYDAAFRRRAFSMSDDDIAALPEDQRAVARHERRKARQQQKRRGNAQSLRAPARRITEGE